MSTTIVSTPGEAEEIEHGADIVLDPLEAFLDDAGLGVGSKAQVQAIGDGHSNLTFLVRRGDEAFVLRRPPRGGIASSANDVLRESSILGALAGTRVPVARVLVRCEDPDVIGAPFFVMSYMPGVPVNEAVPAALQVPRGPERIANEAIDTLVELHSLDLDLMGLGSFGKRDGYLERQIRRFRSLAESYATRPLPDLDQTADWLAANLPDQAETVFVHGDYRLGNLLYAAPLHLSAVLDWELATLGDPLADLGYATAMWASPEDGDNPMFSLSRATAGGGFPDRGGLALRYAEATGRNLERLGWYQVLALWKSAVFLEGSYRRFSQGASTDPFFAGLDHGVPRLAATARAWISQIEG